MLEVKYLEKGALHINEGNAERSMLYRYNVLKKDSYGTDIGICEICEHKVIVHAKREVEIEVIKRGQGFGLTIPMSDDERFFGMGDATRDTVEMRGKKIDIEVKNVTCYGPMPVVFSTDGWALVLNSTYRSQLDFGSNGGNTLKIDTLGGEVDFYLFVGVSLKDLLFKVTEITGRPMMLPKFAYGLTLVHNEQTDARSLLWDIRTIRDRDIPCDTMGLEPTWMEQNYDYTVNKSWNKQRFELPCWKSANQSDTFSFFYPMRKMGMQLSLWLCENYDLFYEEDKNVKADKENEFTEDAVIIDEHFKADVRVDKITVKDQPWFEHLKKFVDNGAAAFKLDGATQVLYHTDRLWGEKYTDGEVHNIYPVILAKQMTNGFRDYTDRRLLLYSSGAFMGIQKYAATWAGDTGGGQKTVTSLLNYAMCGHSNTSCDIEVSPAGLHYGFLLPWSQYFCWANWLYPWFMDTETEDMIRFYAKLRSSLVPYIYTMAYKAYAEALPILRPLPLMYENERKFDNVKNEYMLGDSLLVGVFDMNLTLPEGRWIDYFNGEIYEGDIVYDIPEGRGGALLVKEGSILVTMKPQKYVLEKQHDYIIGVYPSRNENTSFTLFEDDGFTYDYEKGLGCFTKIDAINRDGGFDLIINPRVGLFPGRPDNGHDLRKNSIPEILPPASEKDMTVEIHCTKPSRITLDGENVEFVRENGKTTFIAKTEGRGDKVLVYRIEY
ncbi:MAG: glycoside hydrolase family 31 protein [Ruminococcaceae bacterium]|nr:glycoside hydrolase family 31 protein [Oscillospiraceae bacterium]